MYKSKKFLTMAKRFSTILISIFVVLEVITPMGFVNAIPGNIIMRREHNNNEDFSNVDQNSVPTGYDLISSDIGVKLYRKDFVGGEPNFVQVINLQEGSSVKLLHGQIDNLGDGLGPFGGNNASFYRTTLSTAWNSFSSSNSNAFCITNGEFFGTNSVPTTTLSFSLKVDGQILSDGNRVKAEFPGQLLILELWSDHANIQPLSQDNLYGSTAPDILGGLTEDADKGVNTLTGRTFVGIDDADSNGIYETVLIFNSLSASQVDASEALRDFGADKLIMFDGGGSTQLTCGGTNYIYSNRTIPQTIGVIAGDSGPTPGNTSTASILLLDTSGSMDEEDISGYRKIDAAKSASTAILDVIQTEKQATTTYQHEVGLISFDNSATIYAGLTEDLASLQNTIGGLSAYGATAMADGLNESIDMIGSVDQTYSKMIILLSDGLPNVGLDGTQNLSQDEAVPEVLELARKAGSNNICIHTVGLGIPGGSSVNGASMNEDLLKQIASESGCGNYYNAQTAMDLANVFLEIRHASLGNILFDQKGEISQDERLDLGNVQVEANQETALFTLNWLDGKLTLNVTDPTGIFVDESYPKASRSSSNSVESLVVTDPMEGDWGIGIYGLEVPEGMIDYNVLMSSRAKVMPVETPTQSIQIINTRRSSGSGLLFILMALILGGIGIGLYAAGHKKNAKTSGSAMLIGRSLSLMGQPIRLSQNLIIGRGSGSNIHLKSSNISRSHAQIFNANGEWYIKDLNSSLGTFVNDRAVSTAKLFSGDKIQIGEYVWTFMIDK